MDGNDDLECVASLFVHHAICLCCTILVIKHLAADIRDIEELRILVVVSQLRLDQGYCGGVVEMARVLVFRVCNAYNKQESQECE